MSGPGPAGAGVPAGAAEPSGTRLRLARQARGFSQQQLAGMAGVSRQAVSAVESGASDPSLRVALALARALGLTVEEMFGPRTPAPQVDAQPLAPLGDGGARVTLAAIGDHFVALPLAGAAVSKAGFVPADGLAGPPGAPGTPGAARPVRPLSPPRPTWSWPAAIRPFRCWRRRSACSTRRCRSRGGSARAGRRWSWPRAGSCTPPGPICAAVRGNITSARPARCCGRAPR